MSNIFFRKSQTIPLKLTPRRIEHETLKETHSKISSQRNQVNSSGFYNYDIVNIVVDCYSYCCGLFIY